MQGHHRTPAEPIMPSGVETAQDAGPLRPGDLSPSLVLAAIAQSKIIPEECWDGVCTRAAATASPGPARHGWAVPGWGGQAVQAVAMKRAVQAVFVWLGQCVTATESRLHHSGGEGRAVPSLHLLRGCCLGGIHGRGQARKGRGWQWEGRGDNSEVGGFLTSKRS